MNIELIRNTLFRSYLEDFYAYCQRLGGTTAELLAFEADRRAIMITVNSFGTELARDDRAKLYPRCGKLYPEGLASLAKADDIEAVRAIAEYYADYKPIFDGAGDGSGETTLEDKFFEAEAKMNMMCFQKQFHCGIF